MMKLSILIYLVAFYYASEANGKQKKKKKKLDKMKEEGKVQPNTYPKCTPHDVFVCPYKNVDYF